MLHLLTWVCSRTGFDLFDSADKFLCETRFLFYLATRKLT